MASSKAQSTDVTVIDGLLDWSGGVNSDVVPTVQSSNNPNGLPRNQLAWMDNCTVRGGGVTCREGFVRKGVLPVVGQYMGCCMYLPDQGNPYEIVVIDGHVWIVDVDDPSGAVDLSLQFGLILPITEQCFFCQAEEFLIIQAGDGVTLPLFFDGGTLWQSKGITDTNATTASPPHTNEIPAATSMCYYMGRVWYAQGRNYSAGDIVGGASAWPSSHTPFYGLRDSVLCVQENPLCVGGDGFTVPSSAGNIRAIAYSANINTQLGEGILYIGTRTQIYSLTVPVTRSDWISASSNNTPLQTVALVANGWVGDRSVVEVNGDLFFLSLEPSIRSFQACVRNFEQWGNVPLSVNINRVLAYNDRALMRFSSGIYFENRLLMTALPYACPVGVAHQCILPLNFDVISTLQQQLPPAWEGTWEGLNVLEMDTADFGGLQRAFMFTWSDEEKNIQLWELVNSSQFDNNENRIVWYMEFPALTWGSITDLKKMVSAEMWYDNVFGEVIFRVEYRPDSYVCWYPWMEWKVCTKGGAPGNPQYPQPQSVGRSYRQYQTLPAPPKDCNSVMGRPPQVGYQFQVRLTIKGYCRLRGLFLHAESVERKLYQSMVC